MVDSPIISVLAWCEFDSDFSFFCCSLLYTVSQTSVTRKVQNRLKVEVKLFDVIFSTAYFVCVSMNKGCHKGVTSGFRQQGSSHLIWCQQFIFLCALSPELYLIIHFNIYNIQEN